MLLWTTLYPLTCLGWWYLTRHECIWVLRNSDVLITPCYLCGVFYWSSQEKLHPDPNVWNVIGFNYSDFAMLSIQSFGAVVLPSVTCLNGPSPSSLRRWGKTPKDPKQEMEEISREAIQTEIPVQGRLGVSTWLDFIIRWVSFCRLLLTFSAHECWRVRRSTWWKPIRKPGERGLFTRVTQSEARLHCDIQASFVNFPFEPLSESFPWWYLLFWWLHLTLCCSAPAFLL